MLVDISVNVQTIEEVTVLATKLDVISTTQDYRKQRLTFILDFGVIEASQFVSKREAVLEISGGPVYTQLINTVVPGVDSLLITEWPDLVRTLMETLEASPELIDGENVVLTYLPISLE